MSQLKTKVLITGANGFVGSNLTNYLAKDQNLEIFAMVRPKAPVNFLHQFEFSPKGQKRFQIVEASLMDNDSIENVVQGKDMIIHLAGNVSDWGKKEDFYRLNVSGTEKLLAAASKYNILRVIFLSSLTVHAPTGHTYAKEDTPCNVKNFAYGESKREAEALITKWTQSDVDRHSAIIRPGFIIFGPYDKNSYIQALDGILNGKFGFINRGKALISYVYVENLCYGVHQLISAPNINGVYNILDGNMTWKKWVQSWSDIAKIKPPKLSVPYGLIFPFVWLMEKGCILFKRKKSPPLNLYRIRIPRRDLAFVNTRMATEIGYEAPYTLEEGQQITLEYYYSWKSSKLNRQSD